MPTIIRLDTTVPVPGVSAAEVFTLDGGDNGSIQEDNGGASGDNVEMSGAPIRYSLDSSDAAQKTSVVQDSSVVGARRVRWPGSWVAPCVD